MGDGRRAGWRDRTTGRGGVHDHGAMRRDGDIAPYRNGTAPRGAGQWGTDHGARVGGTAPRGAAVRTARGTGGAGNCGGEGNAIFLYGMNENEFYERHAAIEQRIGQACERAGRDRGSVQLVAVTKTWPPEIVNLAIADGLRVLGENRVQEGLAKAPLCRSAEWHLIGPLQRNKIRHALSLFTVLHSIDSLQVLEDLARISEETGARPDILLEVNVANEATKHGFTPKGAEDAVRKVLEDGVLRLTGLMTIPPWVPEPEQSRPHLRALRLLRDRLEQMFGISLPELSMGMSSDFETAIEEGATYVRIGSALFGKRVSGAWKPQRTPDSDSYYLQN